jgi:hypothetical protein
MRTTQSILKAILAVVLVNSIMGCGKESSFSLLSEADKFTQDVAFNTKVDILWVMDNSGSMESSQSNVADNMQAFIQDFSTKSLDYKMAVTTTDAWMVQFGASDNCSKFREGIRTGANCSTVGGKTYSGVPIMLPSTPNLETVFLTNVLLTDDVGGFFGSGDERAFQSIMRTFEEDSNSGFLRPDSFLSIIIVSDEEDFSHDGTNFTQNLNDSTLYTIDSVADYLDDLTDSTATNRRYNVNAMAVLDAACRTQLGMNTKVNQRYLQLVDKVNEAFSTEETKGKKTSLCGDFAEDLEDIAGGILSLASKFPLQRIPIPETIIVKVNGVTIPNKDTNPLADGGWFYDSASNSIFFTSNYVPATGASISVVYDPAAFGS